MKNILHRNPAGFISVTLALFLVASCSKDDIPDPYVEEDLSSITRLNIISNKDSSVYFFDSDMRLDSGRDNQEGGSVGKESFTIDYTGPENSLLSGAVYEYVIGERNQERKVQYSRNDRNMLSHVGCDVAGWKTDISLSYDDLYRLSYFTVSDNGSTNRYTITYDDRSNVSSVEIYQKSSDVEGTRKIDYGGYDGKPNPFRFLVNVFFAPAFSSKYGPVRYDALPLALLLSKNNPGTMTESKKEGDDYVATGYSYTFDYNNSYDEDGYPLEISYDNKVLEIEIIRE